MKISLAIDRCMGHGQCEMFAPAIFRVGDSDVVEQLREPRPGDAAELEGLRAAARNCPERVISLDENAGP
jgi:ferredoxin